MPCKRLPLIATVLILSAAPLMSPEASGEVTLTPEAAEQIIEKTNQFRKENDLDEQTVSDDLKEAAAEFAKFMARESKYGHHADGRTPAARAEAAGYDYCVVRENIAYRMDPAGPDAAELAEGFTTGWKESEEHRKNMLADFATETGVAVATADGKTFYAVQMFGRPESAKFQIEIQNDLQEVQTVAFHSEDSRDEVQVPPRARLMISRCMPTEISVGKKGKRRLIDKSATLAIRQGDEGQPVIESR